MVRIVFALAVLLLPFGADAGSRPTLTSVKAEIYALVECLGRGYEAGSVFSDDANTLVSGAFANCADEESKLRAAAEAKFSPKAAVGIVASVRARARLTVVELIAEAKLRAAGRIEAGAVESGDR